MLVGVVGEVLAELAVLIEASAEDLVVHGEEETVPVAKTELLNRNIELHLGWLTHRLQVLQI